MYTQVRSLVRTPSLEWATGWCQLATTRPRWEPSTPPSSSTCRLRRPPPPSCPVRWRSARTCARTSSSRSSTPSSTACRRTGSCHRRDSCRTSVRSGYQPRVAAVWNMFTLILRSRRSHRHRRIRHRAPAGWSQCVRRCRHVGTTHRSI